MAQVIYKIINVVNNKFYVGSSTQFAARTHVHRKRLRKNEHHCAHLQAAWNKYGEAAFVFAIVEEVPDAEDLEAAEDKWLAEHHGKEHCYNASRYAGTPWRGVLGVNHPNFGRNHTTETKEKVSVGLKAYFEANPDKRPRLGQKHSAGSRAKMSSSMKGKMAGDKHYRFGKTLSEEVRKKIGDAQRGKSKAARQITPEGRAKIAASAAAGNYDHWTGRKHTEESRLKMSKRVLEETSGAQFPSLTATLIHYKMTMPTLTRALQSGKPIGSKSRYAGLVFKYVTD